MKRNLFRYLFAGRRCIFIVPLESAPFILHSCFSKSFSTLAKGEINTCVNDTNGRQQNLFAEFAATQFNLSSADIALAMKRAPHLGRLKTLENVEKFGYMMKKHGCTQQQIAKVMMTCPSLITINVESILEPKLQLLTNWGIEGADLAKVLTLRPSILKLSLEDSLIPRMTFLESTFQSKDLLIKAVLKHPGILLYSLEKILKPSVAMWEGHGLRGMELAKILFNNTPLLRCTSLTPAKLEFIQKVGIEKGTKMYKYVLAIVAGSRLETLDNKIHNFQLYGLTAEETMELFRVSPYFFTLGKDKVRENMEFIVKNMELPPNSVLDHPPLLRLSLGRVLKPRFLVWEKMKSINESGHLKLTPLYTILTMPEQRLSKVLKRHPESETLCAIYEEAVRNSSGRIKFSGKNRLFGAKIDGSKTTAQLLSVDNQSGEVNEKGSP